MKVTKLRASARRPGFVTVFLDGNRVALLPVEDVRALGLAEGLMADERQREALHAAAERRTAYDAAVRLLAARGRSSQEIVTRLRRKGMAKDAIAHAVGRLEAEGLLEDSAFAREYARARASRGYGRVRILAELAARGVDRHVAELAVAEVGEDDEAERRARLLALAEKRAGQLETQERGVARRRLVQFLLRRGYPLGEVLDVVGQVAAGSSPDAGRR
jgi:regulatory protein